MRSRASIITAISIAALFACAVPAHAGTYTVAPHPCTGSFNGNGWPGGIDCPGGVLRVEVTGRSPVGNYMWFKSPRLPETTYLTGLTYSSAYAPGHSGPEDDAIVLRGCFRQIAGVEAYNAGADGGGCMGQDNIIPRSSDYIVNAMPNMASHCAANCAGIEWRVANPVDNLGGVYVRAITATVADNTAPVVTSQWSTHQISQGEWLRGTVSFGSTGTDLNGSGIKAMALVPDDITKSVDEAATCNYGLWVPCETPRSYSGSFDTTLLSDGAHTAKYTATDAANNVGQSSSFGMKIDNAAPATPREIAPTTNGYLGWSSNNLIGASWQNGPEVDENATQSGLDKVIVDVNPTTGSQANPAPIMVPIGGSASGISATKTSISGLTLPAVGAWTLRLQLVDRAGNVSEVGDGSGASADSDISVGYDTRPPLVPQAQSNGWISRDELAAGFKQQFAYLTPPAATAPICGFAGAIDKNPNGSAGSTINVPGGGSARSWQLPGTLDEDTHYVHLRAVGCNGVASTKSETVAAPVDRTDPFGTIIGVENGRWFRDGQFVELRGSDELSGMAPAGLSNHDSTAGAFLSYTVNGVGPLDEDAPRGGSASISVSGEGSKELRFSPVDLAGNRAAAKVINFGVDATMPSGHIHKQDPARPTLLSATLNDTPSGIAYSVFSVRRIGQGDGDWIQLPTSLTGKDHDFSSGTATARFPDTRLGRGSYEIRITAFDKADNPLATNLHSDGSLATVDNPVRAQTNVSVRLFKALRKCTRSRDGRLRCSIKWCSKKAKTACIKVLRGKVVVEGGANIVTSAYNRGAIAMGVLTDENGDAIRGASVNVSTLAKRNAQFSYVGEATTDSNGIWAVRIPAGASREVRASFEGSETRRPAISTAVMKTHAKLKLRTSSRRAQTGQTITFTGKVTPSDGAFSSGGKIVALQFFAAKKWRPAIGVDHTDETGRFAIKYKFDGRKVRARIVFRVVAPSEDSWGHAFSVSKSVRIYLN